MFYLKTTDNTVIITSEQGQGLNPTPSAFLSKGRMLAYDSIEATELPLDDWTEVHMNGVAADLKTGASQIDGAFVGMTDVINLYAIALLAGEHLFVGSAPGTAKTSMAKKFARVISGKFTAILFQDETSMSDLVGATDPAKAMKGLWERKLDKLATADIALLDEIWKAPANVTNKLLEMVEDKVVEGYSIPLLSVVAASNEIPEDKDSNAMYDRFMLRYWLDYISDQADFEAMLTAAADTLVTNELVNPDHIRLASAAMEYMALSASTDMVSGLSELWREFKNAGYSISNRRWRKILKLAYAHALYNGKSTPDISDLQIAQYCLWTERDEIADVSNLVLASTDPLMNDVLNFEALISDLQDSVSSMGDQWGQDQLVEAAEINKNARKLMREIAALREAQGDKLNGHAEKLDLIEAKSKQLQQTILDKMSGA